MKNTIYIVLYFLISIPTLFLILLQFLDIIYSPFIESEEGKVLSSAGTNNALISLIVSVGLSVLLLLVLRKWFKK